MFRVMNRIMYAQWVFGCSFGLMFGIALWLIDWIHLIAPCRPPKQKILEQLANHTLALELILCIHILFHIQCHIRMGHVPNSFMQHCHNDCVVGGDNNHPV